MNRKVIQCRGCHTTKSLSRNKQGDSEILFPIIFVILFFIVVLPVINGKNDAVSMSIQGIVTDIEISYGTGDSTLITFNGNKTINFRDRIPNIIIGKIYLVTYLHYESGENIITAIQSLKESFP